MPFHSDWIADRHRLKRHLRFWRVAAVVAVVIAVIAGAGRSEFLVGRNHVARVVVEGIIVDDHERTRTLAAIADSNRTRALIVRIDSPGGTVVGGETLFRSLRKVAEQKPVVAVLGQVGTSAAYMTALASDHIVAREGTITGSIGVLLQTTDVTGLLDKLGIRPEAIKSSPLKAQPNPLEPLTPQAREVVAGVVSDIYEMFVGLVEQRRGLSRDAALAVADGRVFTGRQALANGLIDAVGGEDEARDWLAEAHGIDRSLPVRNIETIRPADSLLDLLRRWLGKAFLSEILTLDGLMSIWQPERKDEA